MAKRNANDGSGRGVSQMVVLSGAVADTSTLANGNTGYATGMFCSEEGTINVMCIGDTEPQLIPITAYKDYIWNIVSVNNGGTVDLTNAVLFWQ